MKIFMSKGFVSHFEYNTYYKNLKIIPFYGLHEQKVTERETEEDTVTEQETMTRRSGQKYLCRFM